MYVSEPTNVALGRPTFQWRTRLGRGASLAVDGNRKSSAEFVGSCSTTERSSNSWWAVDLGTVFNVKSVNISQRDQYGKINLS